MYSLENLFANSAHKKSIFNQNEIDFIEEKIYTKIVKDKETPYIKCAIRKKEIKLTPEEVVRQLFIYRLMKKYGYNPAQIKLEHPIHFGREVKKADIVIFEENNPLDPYIIVEVKKFKLSEGKEQLKSYCNATGATISVWTNGEKISFYQRKDPNYFQDISELPRRGQKLSDILRERWTIAELIAKDKLANEHKTLSNLIVEMEDEVLANAGVDVFEEVFKLIYTKLFDEMLSERNKSRNLEFRNYGDSDASLKENIQNLFDRAQKKWAGVFPADDKIKLTPSHLAICISSLQNVRLFKSNLDVIDDAFEYLMSKSQKGEKGQFFTPRYVIDMCVKMLNPKSFETMIDTAAGSCGFPVHTFFYVSEQKTLDYEDYVNENVFAIDFDEKAVRVARTLNLIAGDGKTNVLHLNTLDYDRWDEVIKDEYWDEIYHDGWIKLKKLRAVKNQNRDFNFDIVMANPPFAGDIKEKRILVKYSLAEKDNHKFKSKVGRDILFIERNLQFLKPGGRMAIILPQGRLNNSSDKYIRDFIAEHCRILAVVGLHGNVFKPHTGTKTSVLFVQKWDDELCPQKDDYPIFFATMTKPSKDNSGEKIYVTTAEPNKTFLRDNHGHFIVDHDLFNHDGLTQDGIAEAFIEFAKKENLSFFDSSSFDEIKYNFLLKELEISEINFSYVKNDIFRVDAEFFQKKYVNDDSQIFKFQIKNIGEFSFVTDGQHGYHEIDENSKIHMLTAKNTKNFFANLDSAIRLSKKVDDNNKRSSLQEKDILLSTRGLIGCCSIVFKEILPANIDQDVARIFIKSKNFFPEFITVYLNSKFGQDFMKRITSGAVQQGLSLENVRKIPIPILSKNFQEKIAEIVKSAHEKLNLADEKYKLAEKILSEALGLENFAPSTENIAVKNFSASFGATGRLDAEFYQPKYDDYKKSIKNSGTVGRLCKIYDENFIPKEKEIYSYIELSNVDTNGNISTPEKILGKNLPTRARRIVKAGQVIIASIEGSLQSCALITKENNDALCSNGFFVIDSEFFNSETLLLLFKSDLMQNLMKQSCTGTILTAISPENFLSLPLPILPMETQEKIAAQIEESFKLRAESKKLLELSKSAVEVAIEEGEDAALKIL